MSFFEILGEIIKPGPVGSVDFNDSLEKRLSIWRLVIAAVLVGLVEYFVIWEYRETLTVQRFLVTHLFLGFYLVVSYFIDVKTDNSNLGWIPFLVNNPFRFSDNINRAMFFLSVITIPGKIVSHAVVDIYRRVNMNL